MAIHFWKTENRRLVNDFASEENCKQSICKRGQIPKKGRLSHTQVLERLIDHKYQELTGQDGREHWIKSVHGGFYPSPFLQVDTCLFVPWRNGKQLDSEIPGTKEVLGEDQG